MAMTAEEQRQRALALLELQRQREAEAAQAMSAQAPQQQNERWPVGPGEDLMFMPGSEAPYIVRPDGTSAPYPQPDPAPQQPAEDPERWNPWRMIDAAIGTPIEMALGGTWDVGQGYNAAMDRSLEAQNREQMFTANASPAEQMAGGVGAFLSDPIGMARGGANAYATGVAEGIPALGPLTVNAADAAGAQIAALLTGRPADELRAEAVAQHEADMEPFGGLRTAGQVTGAVGPLAAASTSQLGGQLLGVTGSFPQRIGAGLVSGGAIAGGDTLARTGDPMAALTATGIGAGAGAAFPLAERPLAAIMRMLSGQSAPNAALQTVARGLEREGIPADQMLQRLDDIGPGAAPIDLGTNLTRQGGAIAALPGEGATTLRNFLGDRAAQTNPRIQAQINSILGEAPVPSALQADIRSSQRALGPEYEAALANARAVDTSGVAETLDSLAVNLRGDAQTAAQQVRRMLNVVGTDQLDPNPQTLLQTRQAIDGLLSSTTDNNVRRVLGQARQQVDDLLTDAVPGIKAIDNRYAELARQTEAVETGQRLLDSGRTALRPAEVEQLMQQQGVIIGPTGVPFRLTQGARAEIDRLIGTTGNNLTALKSALKGDGSWNRDRLVTLFGQDRADALLDVLEREVTFNRTFDVVARNSETAARSAAMQEVSPRQFGQQSTSLTDLLMRVPQGLANAGARSRSEAVNAQIAQLLTNRPGDEVVRALSTALAQQRGQLPPSVAALLATRAGD